MEQGFANIVLRRDGACDRDGGCTKLKPHTSLLGRPIHRCRVTLLACCCTLCHAGAEVLHLNDRCHTHTRARTPVHTSTYTRLVVLLVSKSSGYCNLQSEHD